MHLSDTAILAQKPGVLAAAIDDLVVIMSAERAEYYELNPIAADIWKRLANPRQVAELIAELVGCYEGDPALVGSDVRHLLTELAGRDLLDIR